MKEARTTPAKHVFLDVVGFTKNRSVEAQADIVQILNLVVRHSLEQNNITKMKRILLPTGDGLDIALLNLENPYDIHIRLALSILEAFHQHNANPKVHESRKFEVRIGISANTDNVVTDVNGRLNIAGAGINEAQRVMSNADSSQILVSQVVHNTLRYREKYIDSFERHSNTIKHDEQLTMYQLKIEGSLGLNTETPSAFKPRKAPEKQEPRLNRRLAYYMAHAIKNKQTILDKNLSDERVIVSLLYFLAKDSEAEADATELDTVYPDTYKAGQATFEEQYEYYSQVDRNVSWELYRFIGDTYFWKDFAHEYFHESADGIVDFRFVSETGKSKLKADWPQIWESFGLKSDQLKEEVQSG